MKVLVVVTGPVPSVPKKTANNEVKFAYWLVDNGYPISMINLALRHSRYWESEA
jgi:hypothetical protein